MPEHQIGSMLVGLIQTAVLEMKEAARTGDAMPRTMLSFMRSRSAQSPQDMQLFCLIKYLGTLLLFRKAERRNKIDLYFSCMRLSLPLLAVMNCNNYVLIFTETLKFWDGASELEKDIIRKYGFTLETPNGVHVGMDFGFEKYVRLVRDQVGKIHRVGNELKLESAAMLRMSKEASEGIKDSKVHVERDLKRYDARVLAKTMLLLKSLGAWSDNQASKPREPDTDSVYSMVNQGEKLLTELFHTDSIGTDLVTNYIKKFSCSLMHEGEEERRHRLGAKKLYDQGTPRQT